MSKYLPLEQLLDLINIVDVVSNSKTSWETKYDIIFSSNVSLNIYNLIRKCNLTFDYSDPDSSYEDDVKYFRDALFKLREEIIPVSSTIDNT